MTPQPAAIAIIGMGLRLPGTESLDGLWDHLAAARSLITEVPAQRWDKEAWRGNPARGNKTASIWGGFVADADCFDSGFFAISPREAAWMDPQQRFALEMAWHAIEDAGYRASALAGSRTGVFMGVCHWDYAELLEKHLAAVDAYTPTGIAFSIIANRVSHFFDLRGPSVTNDTACAASMTAVHDAVAALRAGQCDMALAGGVNLIWSPNHFVAFSKAGMLSRDGRAKAFDESADGYVRGEGGAVLLLKPLERALADGDPIHGVIRGIGINHGGRTNSLTVTNPEAQATLIAEVLTGAGLTPADIAYLEAHGPGTPLGDPIEIAGLKQAFARLHRAAGTEPRPGAIGIGSVKTNMGHLEGAAGVAGMVKVLAALRHGQLPANVGFQQLNRLIDLSGSDFRIQAEATPWPPMPGAPRRAGVSSFGFGGSNGHVVIEEAPQVPPAKPGRGAVVLPFSARDDGRLRALAAALRAFAAQPPAGVSLADLALTLQTGREALDTRAAITAATWEQAVAALEALLAEQPHPGLLLPGGGGDGPGQDWVNGKAVTWPKRKARRIHAPLYPFDRQRHWLDLSVPLKDDGAVAHPLLHRNVSDFAALRWQTRLPGDAPVWADHHVGGTRVLPGMAALEMARAAAERGTGSVAAGWSFTDWMWTRPVLDGGGVTEIESVLHRQGDALAFTLAQADGERVRGSLRPLSGEAPAALDLAALRAAAPRIVPPAECYARLRADGVEHGPAFQVLTHIQAGDGFVLAQIKLGRRQQPALAEMPLHPVVLDAAIQAWAALDGDHPPGAAVPFACRRLDMWGACEPVMWARIRRASVPQTEGLIRLDIELLDKDGRPRVVFHDLSLRAMNAAPSIAAPFLAAGAWRDRPLPPRTDAGRTVTIVLAGLSDGPPGAIPLPAANPDDMAASSAAWIAALHGILRNRLRGQDRQRILVLADAALPPLLTRPLAALLMTARQEQPRLDGALVQVAGSITAERLAAIAAAEATRGDGWPELRHEADGRRLAWVPEEITAAAPPLTLAPGATYWITGGLGGLGRIFARWLLERGAGQVVLSGRAEIAADDARLAELGERVRYVPCDLTDSHAVAAAVAGMPGLRGVIHAAGVLDDAYMLTRAADANSAVLAPKLAGTLALDAATRGLDLDFLVLCSSVAARFGNAGQAEYAAANAFMDGFAEGAQHRTVLSVGWPLWAEGGMGVDSATQAALTRRFGTIPMPTATGLAALEYLLAAGAPACATVLHGRPERLRQMLADFGQGAPETAPAAQSVARPADLEARAQDFLRAVLADVLHLEPGQIRVNRKLDEYGLDSIAIVEATNRLEESLGPLSKTLFFEYVDLAGIAAHLVAEHGAALTGALGDAPAAATQPERAAVETIRARPTAEEYGRGTHDVAIIGLSLKVAKAGDQQSFWDMLAQGLHGFEPYPADRWNHAALLHPERDVLGKTVVKTGCFLDDIAAFDPRYFRISQYEAELMSPEVRLFLQTSVEAFEDAGYSRETMRTRLGGDVAIIMGSMTNEYDLYGFQNMLMRGSLASGSYTGTVPNMVSYFYGFTGPSYFLDTMCSASSTCVHEAVHMLRAGRCQMALAGGISLLLHPQKLIATSQEHFTSKTAEVIRGYGLGADGTILGEGVGALVLKRLADAERDGDHIYGIIRGTAISNAGVRNGFTVPNPHQQAAAIVEALDDAGITADTIGYVEGHGSGTALGDPIEVKALTQAWRRHTDTMQTCPIGTVKSNVGHLLAASGLAGIVKVLMQMRHGMLAPSLHAEILNPNIPFAQTPFVVQRRLEPWTRRKDASGAEIPRRAGITSIGAGGMNSHIVIEEYTAPPAALPADAGPHILVLSAMGEAQLAEVARRFHAHLLAHPEQALADLAYTLQVGRNQLPCRMAVVVADRAAAAARLAAFIAAPGAATGLYYARTILECDPLPADLGDPESVAAAWVSGTELDWDSLHAGRQPRRLSLPSYPFERVRCWYPEWPDAPSVVQPLGSRLKLHPLIGENRSDLSGLRYSTRLYLDELRDYVQKRDRQPEVLPLAALEAMLAVARVAGMNGPLALADLRVLADMDWAKAQELTAELDADIVRLAVDGTAWAEARLTQGFPRPAPANSGGTRIDAAELYDRLRQKGYDFAPYLESVAHAVLAPGGAVTCVLRADPPQQDHFKRGTCIAAPALAAAFQALLLATDGPAVLAGLDGAVLSGTADIARVVAAPKGDGFGLWFLDGDGAPMAACHGVRLAASANTAQAAQPQTAQADPRLVLAHELRAHAAELLKFPAEQLGLREAFHDLGFDSISLARLAAALSTAYGISLSPAVFFEAEHVEALAEHLMARHNIAAAARPAQPARAAQLVRRAAAPGRRDGVAIIGMAGRFPGADSIPALFYRLLAGDDLTGPAPAARGFKTPWRGGFLADVERFDAALFRVSPVEAERMDPQQRLMLETAWRCLEDAGLHPEDLPAATAVYVGASAMDYGQLLREAGISDGYAATGNSLAMIANRLSHFFNWSGASQTIDTACSSSLVALVRGAEAVRRGDCPAALVGGVNLTLAESGFQGPAQASMLSPDGRCKAFGAAADGYGRGEGVVAVLLKRLDQAERDGDRILGVLFGTAENHGGRAGSLTAPSVTAQAALLRAAWSGIDPTDISYIEAHGTGTELGDPVELNGLRRAWEAATGSAATPHASVAVGTLKSNIGHLEAAAGLAGLVKILAAMQRGRLPASLHCQPPNPHLELAGGPFRLLQEAEDWPRPRLAGLSSFGFGGANAHVVVADPPAATMPHRAPLPPRAFADTRFWLPGRSDATLVFTPFWHAAMTGATPRPQRLVITAGMTVTDSGVRVEAAPADPAALAPRLLALLQEVLASDTLVQLVVPLGAAAAGLGAMLDTACLESPRLRGQVIEVAPGIAPAELARLLAAEDGDSRVRYQNGQRLVRRWRELAAGDAPPWRPRGVFLITGANGGLGRLLARHIAATVPGAVLVLAGSRPEDAERTALVDEVRRLGAVAAYRQADMADRAAVQALIRHVTEVHGRLDVVLHCAGTLRDGWLKTKRAEDMAAVMAPKVGGAAALITACAGVDLQALVLFSSLAGAFGNAGQADYAAANGVLDALAEAHDLPVVAIDWPLWAEGGMSVDDSTAEALFQRMGQRPLSRSAGLAALERIVAAKVSRAAVLAGDEGRIRAFFAAAPAPEPEPEAVDQSPLAEQVATRLAGLFAQAGGFAPGAVDVQVPLEQYGIDSLMITRLNAALGDVFAALPKTLFFQYRTLAEVAAHLAASHGSACRHWLGGAAVAAPVAAQSLAPVREATDEPIAIIGIAGCYPGADSLDQFWDNLCAGRDMVGEIPAERWRLDGFYTADRDRAAAEGLSYGKWGAFLDGFADFDPLFFRISPRDAAAMDPQERLFLMCAWAAAEDAGYAPARLAAANPVGVFVGITKTGFALHDPFPGAGGAMVRPQTSFAGAANRVSHALDLTGPSVAVDTMCSASLTALHEACESLRAGRVSMALAGGVNLYLHPRTFIDLSAARMLSPSGRCAAFGAGADGFVPGEGVGCVVLKPLSRALADGDRIHAVIRATAINHGGHSNGYTVPNPAAQRDLVRGALAQAGLRARDVTCVEAHGTGTELGDPIELEGLIQAFAPDTGERGFCALGSVKSAIGHLEAAAGIAGVTKMVLALRHRQVPPTLHADSVNPNLRLDNSPFVLHRALGPWPAGPRVACVSSFGAGGANAHAILAEGPAPAITTDTAPQVILLSARTPERLRVQAANLLAALQDRPAVDGAALRARLAELLGVAAADIDGAEDFDGLGLEPSQRLALLRWVEDQSGQKVDAALFAHLSTLDQLAAHLGGGTSSLALADIAHTLQVGREAMEHRLGLVATSVPDLAARLRRWLDGDNGAVRVGHAPPPGIADDGRAARWWHEGNLDELVTAWVDGLRVEWTSLPRPARPAIVSLPTYPFERQRFWLPIVTDGTAIITAPHGDAGLEADVDALDRAIAPILARILADTPDVVPALQRWRDAARALLGDAAPVADPWAAWRALGAPTAQMKLAETCLRALPDILTGQRAATAIMFPDGRLDLVEAVYKDNPVAARFSRNLAQAAAAFVTAQPRTRILEIGAGTGGTSEPVFAALAPHWERVAEYRYTDLSRAFLIHAERTYGPRVPPLTTALFDVEKPLAGQDVTPGGYDLVIAANVLHATADMGRTLGHVRQLLAPGGVLLLNETASATLFTHVTFGLLDGWWRFTDPQRRIPGTPSLSPDSWRAVLAESGFDWLAGSSPAECALGQQILAARATGPQPQAVAPVAGDLGQRLRTAIGETLNMAAAAIDPARSFADYGLDSILGAELVHRLRRDLGVRLEQADLFDHKNLAELEAFLAGQSAAPVVITARPAAEQPIAIVGYAGRFAKSADAEALWRHLAAGRDLVEPASRFDLDALYRDAAPGSYGRHGSFLDDVAAFDPAFFGISGLEARYMDPQQRLFLEEAWKTLEHAGHAGPDIHGRRVGVFAGCSSGDYDALFGKDVPGQAFWGNTASLVPARIAYFLDLKGPAVTVDTACSSSLVAVHLACRALWDGECDMALAGGVFVQSTARFFRSANQAGMLSPSGRCAAFGAGADGIVPGEAVGAVLLRPLADALADGDTIHGVIVASGTNQDGTTNGITAPSAQSQERLIRSVYDRFGITPDSVGLVEAHGTGTPLGDPIEHAALARAFGALPKGSVLLGSVKSNIGHATTAAGIAGLIKVLLSLKHSTVPPTLHFNGGNPAIRFAEAPFAVNSTPAPWPHAHRRAAISSFGFSGTNAHVVVDQPPAPAPRPHAPGPYLFVLGGRDRALLRRQAQALAEYVGEHPELAAADIAFTLAAGRRPLHHRLAVIAADTTELQRRLRRWLDGEEDSVIGAAEIPGTTPEPTTGDLESIARAVLAGAALPLAQLFPQGGARVPLPATILAATRCWVTEATSPAPVATRAALPLHLPPAETLAGPFMPQPPMRVTLAPLNADGRIERRAAAEGIRHLVVTGAADVAAELAAAEADQTLRVVMVEGAAVLPPCALPVVTVTGASGADFTAAEPQAALALAEQIAQAPRLALVELKRTMSRPGRVPQDVPPEWRNLWTEAAAAPAWSGVGAPLALTSDRVEATLFDDGVVLLRMVERADKNCFTDALMDGLSEAFAAIARLPQAKAVVLTGFDGYFACGGTRDGLSALQQGATRFTDRKIYSLPLSCPLPVIAAMQGHAIGAGWSLGLFCDHALFAAEGVYHSNYLWFGFTPGAGATLIFPARLGDALGREVLFTAREYRGRELAGRLPSLAVLPAAQVEAQALALAHGLARHGRDHLTALKARAIAPLAERLDAVFAEELDMHTRTFVGNDRVRERIDRMFPTATPPSTPARPDLRRQVVDSLAEELMIDAADIRDGAGFLELGLDSILAVTWLRKLNAALGTDLPATAVYAYPTIGALVEHLGGLRQPEATPPAPAPAPAPAQPRRRQVVESLAEELMIDAADIRDGAGFLELGLDSILAVTWLRKLNAQLGTDLPATAVYAHPTLGALVAHLSTLRPEPKREAAPVPIPPPAPAIIAPRAAPGPEAVAIIGASGRFPKSRDLDAFWDNIRAGRDCIEDVPPSRWDVARFYHPDPLHPGTSYCKWMGVIDDVECFDAGFFTMTPREAALTDPQQRLFLEHAWQAFEDAAQDPSALGGSTCGVFVGAGPSGYADRIAEHNAYSLLGRSSSILAARIAHLLDLRGPCIALDTACSSSLVAIAEACDSLLLGNCDMALAGGVSVMIGPEMFIDTSKVSMLSKDGRCFTFDSRANGFVPGEGAGVLLLKRLADAERDGDPVHAIIRGWGTNQDGRTNGITAPNPQAQSRLIQAVHRRFAIDPASFGLVECHGTGTPLGDPIEIEGLTGAFAGAAMAAGSCAIGSLKSNMGHMLAAAGVAGVMKAMQAVARAEIPPSIHFETLNEHIRLNGTPFAVATKAAPWPQPLRRAGVSSFGFSGTNAHVVVENAPVPPPGARPGPWLLALSARHPAQLADMAASLRRFVLAHGDVDLGDVAHTLQIGRKAQPCRLAAVFRDRDSLLQLLDKAAAGQGAPGLHLSRGDGGSAPFDDDDARALAARWLASGDAAKLDKAARLWADGMALDWRTAPPGRRLHLPGTVFARDRHWIEAQTEAPPPAAAHPLLAGATASAAFTVSPPAGDGLGLPELARAAAERASGRPVLGLRHLMWGAAPAGGSRLEVAVEADGQGWLYRVAAVNAPLAPLHLGEVDEDPALPPPADIAALCSGQSVDIPGIAKAWRQGGRLTARLELPQSDMLFDPAMLGLLVRVLAVHAQGGQAPLVLRAATTLCAAGPVSGTLFLRIETAPGAAHPTLALFDGQGKPRLLLDGPRLAPFTALAGIPLGESA